MSNQLTIRTNNVPRPLLHSWDLSLTELAEFDYLVSNDQPIGFDYNSTPPDRLMELWSDCSARFFRYKCQLYYIGEFVRIVPQGCQSVGFEHHDHNGQFTTWCGIASDSYFSGLLVKWPKDDDTENIVVGRYFS
jgi:hypothetical protein